MANPVRSYLLNPEQDYDDINTVVSGWNGQHDLQFAAKVKDGETIVKGALVSIDAAGEMVNGLSVAHAMPMWAINGSEDHDVKVRAGGLHGGRIGAYPASGGYEMRTTELVEADIANMIPNAPLVAATAGDIGKVVSGTVGAGDTLALAESVVGICSVGAVGNLETYKQQVVSFWSVYLPARA